MKNQIKINKAPAGALLLLLGLVAGSGAFAAIQGTKHDLSITGANTAASGLRSSDQTEICIFCHTPHAAIKNDNIPLWNHNLSAAANYGTYSSPTMNATPADFGGVDATTAAVSNLCMSCHDGTVALNSLSNVSNNRPTSTFSGTGMIPAGATNLGTGVNALKDDHPVNFTYDAALVTADQGTAASAFLTVPASTSKVTGANGASVTLYSSKVQCASCHDPHTSADAGGKAFLRVTMDASKLCLTCHIK